ncbi:hypothetical protein [Streptosporangium sp. NPDC087985]|uniref:hypothetical protein n=1 Tax=Streptosporangium sp. NPDC087985 TaxID=3366196 RepID=UPI0037F1B27C
MRLYGLRTWIEQGYKQVKDELGWADFQVRSDAAIRRHWALVACTFTFCWPRAARHVRGWLTSCALLQRWWRNWSSRPPPAELQVLVTAVTAGRSLNLYAPP